jgi:hypothetical protein
MIRDTFDEITEEMPYFNNNYQIDDFINGNVLINIHAVYVVCLSLRKQCITTIKALKAIEEEDDKFTRRDLLQCSFKLASFFDFMYAAMVTKSNMLFWKKKPNSMIRKMMAIYEYEIPVGKFYSTW